MTLFSPALNDDEDEDTARESALTWHCIPAEGLWSGERVWLHEPRDANINHLLKQIRNGKYKKPFAIDSIRTRRLHFSLRYVQSEMLLDFPKALVFSYTRQMAGFLLFCPRPEKIVVVGLGGGSLTKFCHHNLPMARITTIEIDPNVVAFGELFQLPDEDSRHRIVNADAADYLPTLENLADVVLLDGCDEQGIAPAFCDPEFFTRLRSRRRPQGRVVVNIIGLVGRATTLLNNIRCAFADQVIVLNARSADNRIVFAFNDPWMQPDWTQIEARAELLTKQCGMDFHQITRFLRTAYGMQLSGSYLPPLVPPRARGKRRPSLRRHQE